MSEALLRRLAAEGLDGHGEELTSIGTWCRSQATEDGDARWLAIEESVSAVARWWAERDAGGGAPSETIDAMSAVVTTKLAPILDAADAGEATALGYELTNMLLQLIRDS